MLPKAKASLSCKLERILTISSGNDVPKATIVIPIIIVGILNFFAIETLPSTRDLAPASSNTSPAKSNNIGLESNSVITNLFYHGKLYSWMKYCLLSH